MRTAYPVLTKPTARAGPNNSARSTASVGMISSWMRLRALPRGGLQGRYTPRDRRPYDVGATTLDFGDALLGGGEVVADALNLLRHDCGQLGERKPSLGELVLLCGHLLVQPAEDLLLLHARELASPEIDSRHLSLRAQLLRRLQLSGQELEAILLQDRKSVV